MSFEFGLTKGNTQRVEIWSHDSDHPQQLRDMAMEKLAPIVREAYPGKEFTRESVHSLLVLALDVTTDEVVGGMLIQVFGDEWTRTSDLATYQEAVRPHRQRQGFGTLMFKTLKAWAMAECDKKDDPDAWHISRIRCAVDWDDSAGKAFMEKQDGFTVFAEYNNEIVYEWDNEDCPIADFVELDLNAGI
jgi:GNAT superfamily N-acetyltransferase